MGFSLVGNSGDTSTSTTNYNYTADLNPQLDFQGAAGGNLGINFSPLTQGGAGGAINPEIYDYYAPINVSAIGSATGDAALQALSTIAQAQLAPQLAPGTSATSTPSLFSGNTLYWILGAIVLFFLAEEFF